jgi:hypothetical protein
MSGVSTLRDVDGREWSVPSDLLAGESPAAAPRAATAGAAATFAAPRAAAPLPAVVPAQTRYVGPVALPAPPLPIAQPRGYATGGGPVTVIHIPAAPPARYVTPVPAVEEDPPPLCLRIIVAPFAFLWVALVWLCCRLPELVCTGIARCCDALGPCLADSCNACGHALHQLGRACCSVVRSIESAGRRS